MVLFYVINMIRFNNIVVIFYIWLVNGIIFVRFFNLELFMNNSLQMDLIFIDI